jgi:hypothetical protein
MLSIAAVASHTAGRCTLAMLAILRLMLDTIAAHVLGPAPFSSCVVAFADRRVAAITNCSRSIQPHRTSYPDCIAKRVSRPTPPSPRR